MPSRRPPPAPPSWPPRPSRRVGRERARRPVAERVPVKLGLISDVHGDPLALELAWSHLTVLGGDRIVCAGGRVVCGPCPARVVDVLAGQKVDAVRGNHDRWALERGPGGVDEFGGGTPGP